MSPVAGAHTPEEATAWDGQRQPARPLLTVVVPVYNGGADVVENVVTIRRAVAEGLPGEEVEVIVVSDGSIDGSGERLLEARGDTGVRVIHYDRNLGKGYAVKAGGLASQGEWVALIDADLDLDPRAIPSYLHVARREGLDIVIGSKRHPDSVVHYPRSRRLASWLYQRLNRLLFRLDVRDTQVGLKVFSRRIVDEVFPLVLVKRFAFDLEVLAVARALGLDRIQEMPVRLNYRFAGSGVRSLAVLGALWDTLAIYYRLHLLRTYQRKRSLLHRAGAPARHELPPVSVLGGEREAVALLDYPRLEPVEERSSEEGQPPLRGELVALLASGARPAGNWITAAVPFFSDPGVAAVVVPTVTPLRAPLRERVAAAVLESRLGGGSRRSVYLPGNIRVVLDHPAEGIVVRREDYLAAREAGVEDERLVAWLAERGRRTIYTPDTSISLPPPPVLLPHLRGTFRHAQARGAAARRTRGASLSRATALSFGPPASGIVGLSFLMAGGSLRTPGAVLLLLYAGALAASGIHAAARFRSLAVGLLQPLVVVATQAAYLGGFARGLAEGRLAAPLTRPGEGRAQAG
jgi:glycosyltransferase involved in cell wall biosynthesis